MLRKLLRRNGVSDPLIPPREINYNAGKTSTAKEYAREYKEQACLRELPFLMRQGLTPDSTLLDYGCGLGRLAYAAGKYLSTRGTYFGYEPNQQALGFLKTAYKERVNFRFSGANLALQDDYVALQLKPHADAQTGVVAGKVDFSFIDRPVDVQWTCSVFTHMHIEPIESILREFSKVLAPNGVCVNTWLCIDDFAEYVLRCGLADRELPYRHEGAWTYSKDNPLVCVAYPLSTMRELYARAGHEIIQILWGSWSGRDNGVLYQDIVVSRPRR